MPPSPLRLQDAATAPRWSLPALLAILALAAVLYSWNLSGSGLNSFYSAAVLSGTESWKAWFGGFPRGGSPGRGTPPGGQGGQVPEGMQGGQASDSTQSGQASDSTQGDPGGGGMGGGASGELIAYLKKHQDGAEWLLAVSSSQGAAQLIVSSGEPVISMWGWSGSDKAMTLTKLKELVKKGELHYVQLGGGMGGGPGGGSTVRSEVTAWVQKHGTAVKESDYSNSTSTASGKRLRILFAVRPVDRLPPGRVRRQLTRRDRTPSNGPAPRSGAVPASPIMYTGCPANG